ncbi:hypothetical protein D5H75_39715 [Bailinhaonella thermotolerans]|uniref:Uncharacterized protein n=1 Tax=Bailinhaonella thermotolerans TaxID=1070861 RepID=A0A3A4AM90_9ACTN|nr:hypothetical protein D5H75_39715 [Bailinhaonella thermotolerans]
MLDPSNAGLAQFSAGDTPPEAVMPVFLAMTWAGSQSGQRANRCVDACRTLGYALGEIGVVTELRATEVIVHDRRTGAMTRCAPEMPTWRDVEPLPELNGHCILTLPEQGRWIDATIEQFPGVRGGPAVGRCGGIVDPRTGAVMAGDALGPRLPQGAHVAIGRGHLMLLYTLSPDEASARITGHHMIRHTAEEHRRTGLNLLSVVLARAGESAHLAALLRTTPHPRLHALLDALAGTSLRRAANGDALFDLGDGHAVRLDEFDLPADTPSPVTPA